ncbi:hypothetical protein ACTMTI_44320 [Nonomuraea sp. H19]|uniref:hypothetical protein n=1 Tax=Nonomuraea sp. H19 TaxID=3452206 RepID=UPI003F8A6D14
MDENQGAAGADPVGEAIEYVCQHLADIRWQLEQAGDTGPLDRLLAALRADAEVDGLIRALHEALQAGGDALGVYGNVRSAIPKALGDFGLARPKRALYLCPGRRCARYAWFDPAASPPVCGIDGEPMLQERL